MKPDQKPLANPSIILREEFDDWAVLFDPDTGKAFGVNPIGVFVWKHLDEKHTVADIVEALQTQCDDTPEEAEEDISNFIEDLIKRGYAGFSVNQG